MQLTRSCAQRCRKQKDTQRRHPSPLTPLSPSAQATCSTAMSMADDSCLQRPAHAIAFARGSKQRSGPCSCMAGQKQPSQLVFSAAAHVSEPALRITSAEAALRSHATQRSHFQPKLPSNGSMSRLSAQQQYADHGRCLLSAKGRH